LQYLRPNLTLYGGILRGFSWGISLKISSQKHRKAWMGVVSEITIFKGKLAVFLNKYGKENEPQRHKGTKEI
jgi:hypothetical protein